MKRVFILSGHALFGRCIETLLRQEGQVRIVGHVKDVDLAIEQVRALQPDVVIVDSNEPEAIRGKIMMQVMKAGLKTRVVGLNLQDNKVFVCRGEQKVIQDLGDFVKTITFEASEPSENDVHGHPRLVNAPSDAVTRDQYGRTLDYLRVSVTDRCNLRCVYCMPAAGISAKPRDAILHSEEIARMVEAAASVGFRAIRLTGGEPLVRKGIVGLVRRVAGISGIEEVSLTTNATLLSSFARDLAGAGLTRVNISLDSLRPERFRRITRLGNLASVWQGIAAAEVAGLAPLKINMVVVRGFNDDEVADFARLTLEHPWHVRFIEVMPLTGIAEWGPDLPPADRRLVPMAEVQQQLQAWGPLIPDSGPGGHGPARHYRLPNAQGTLGFISPLSDHFCSSCNRLRLTPDGYLRACLFSEQGIYCKPALVDGASLHDLQTLIRQAGNLKPESHSAVSSNGVSGTAMSLIGG